MAATINEILGSEVTFCRGRNTAACYISDECYTTLIRLLTTALLATWYVHSSIVAFASNNKIESKAREFTTSIHTDDTTYLPKSGRHPNLVPNASTIRGSP